LKIFTINRARIAAIVVFAELSPLAEMLIETLQAIPIDGEFRAATGESQRDLTIILTDRYDDLNFCDFMATFSEPSLVLRIGADRYGCGPYLDAPEKHWSLIKPQLKRSETPALAADSAPPLSTAACSAHQETILHWMTCLVYHTLKKSPEALLPVREIRLHAIGSSAASSHFLICPALVGTSEFDARQISGDRPEDVSGSGTEFNWSEDRHLFRFAHVLDPVFGIVPFVRVGRQRPVAICTALFAEGAYQLAQSRSGFLPAGGKGYSLTAARMGCLGEAVERFACIYHANETVRKARVEDILEPYLAPGDLLGFSHEQYEWASQADEANSRGSRDWIPKPFDQTAEISWVSGKSLHENSLVWVPAAYAFLGYFSSTEPAFCIGDSNGCASGPTLSAAVFRGLLELIERDACAIWWYNRLERCGYDLTGSGDRRITDVVDSQRANGRRVEVLDISSELGVSVCAAVSANEDGSRIRIGLGAALDDKGAILQALAELEQLSFNDTLAFPAVERSKEAIDWYGSANLAHHPYLVPRAYKKLTPNRRRSCAALQDILRELHAQGFSVYVLNMSRQDLPLAVARVIVPGLRHLQRRLAPGRLYDVPVRLGLRRTPTREREMNPFPVFF
jgi:thiazole/oxazole-forming peptide maturase SagD family component